MMRILEHGEKVRMVPTMQVMLLIYRIYSELKIMRLSK